MPGGGEVDQGETTVQLKHSEKGIVSLVFASVFLMRMFLEICFPATCSDLTNLSLGNRSPFQLSYYAAILWIVMPYSVLLGTGYAIAALIETNRKRLFAVLGIIINGLIILALLICSTFPT